MHQAGSAGLRFAEGVEQLPRVALPVRDVLSCRWSGVGASMTA